MLNTRKYNREYYEKNKKRLVKLRKSRERKNYSVYLWASARYRAKKFGLPFNLEQKDVVIPKVCPVLGMTLNVVRGGPRRSAPSIDRIVPEKGYVKGNILVISMLANQIKGSASAREVRMVADWLEEIRSLRNEHNAEDGQTRMPCMRARKSVSRR